MGTYLIDYNLVYVPGKENVSDDSLSRLPLPASPTSTPVPPETVHLMDKLESSPITPHMIRSWTERETLLSRIKRCVKHGWPETAEDEASKPYFIRRLEISLQDGRLLWGSRVIVPPPGCQRVLEELHSMYTGIYHTKSYARAFVWWPKLDEQIEQTVHDCSVCQSNQKSPPEVSMQPW